MGVHLTGAIILFLQKLADMFFHLIVINLEFLDSIFSERPKYIERPLFFIRLDRFLKLENLSQLRYILYIGPQFLLFDGLIRLWVLRSIIYLCIRHLTIIKYEFEYELGDCKNTRRGLRIKNDRIINYQNRFEWTQLAGTKNCQRF